MVDKVAICIANYRMPERTNSLVEEINANSTYPHDFFIVDMIDGPDDSVGRSKYATLSCFDDLQMCTALKYAVAESSCHEFISGKKYLAYWMVTTSMYFLDDSDILSSLAEKLLTDPQAVQLSPSLDKDSGTAWKNMLNRPNCRGWRKTFGMDSLATMYRADWFNEQGGYNPQLTYGWGMDMELSWKARKQGRTSWINDDLSMHKEYSIAYRMGRWHETPEQRGEKASKEMHEVLSQQYGDDFIEKLMREYITPDMGSMS